MPQKRKGETESRGRRWHQRDFSIYTVRGYQSWLKKVRAKQHKSDRKS